jgi:hypothetical protein
MSNKPIYHYVYRITNIIERKHYYGKRSCRIEPKLDLGKKYFSSSRDKEFMKDQKKNPQNYKYKIVSIVNSAEDATRLEIKLHNKMNVGVNESFYNKAKSRGHKFDTTGKVPVKDIYGNYYQVSVDDPRYLSGEFVHTNKGMITAIDSDGNYFLISKDDPKYLSGELKHSSTGMVNVKDMNGVTMRVRNDDPRYLNGELVGVHSVRYNIRSYRTGELLAWCVGLSNWCSSREYSRKLLAETIKGDPEKPHKSNQSYPNYNPCHHKGIYAELFVDGMSYEIESTKPPKFSTDHIKNSRLRNYD